MGRYLNAKKAVLYASLRQVEAQLEVEQNPTKQIALQMQAHRIRSRIEDFQAIPV